MYLSSERKPVGREFLSEIAWRKAKKIQCLRQDEREMREETRQDDSRKESRNRKDETSTKKGVTKSHPFCFKRLKYLYNDKNVYQNA